MGLDSVELLMYVEEEFNIEIDDADVGELLTVGDLHLCVVRKLAADNDSRSGTGLDMEAVWERLSAILVTRYAVKPARITKRAEIVKDLRIN